MKRALTSLLLTFGLAATASPSVAEESFLSRALASINETTPVGLKPAGSRSAGWGGWFDDAWYGMRDVAQRGENGLLLPAYTVHPAFEYPNRKDQNGYTWGGGISRSVIDERGNERLVYALAFSDSHYDIQPFFGYAWLARWPLGNTGLYGGLGYTLAVTLRSDSAWLPIPAPLPLASIGTDRFGVYAAYVPFSNVAFLFAKAQFDDVQRRGSAPVTGSPWSRRNLAYGSFTRVHTDQEGIQGLTVESGNGGQVGYRHFVSHDWAIEVSAGRSSHALAFSGARLGSFDLANVSVAAQYHIEASESLRLHAGAGAAYWSVQKAELGANSLERSSFAPLVQAGATWAVTRDLHLTGGLTMGFPRFDLSRPGETTAAINPAPASFHIGLGYAW